jgi:hypothetical protein
VPSTRHSGRGHGDPPVWAGRDRCVWENCGANDQTFLEKEGKEKVSGEAISSPQKVLSEKKSWVPILEFKTIG